MSEPNLNLPAKRQATQADQVKALIQSPQFVDRVSQALPRHCTPRRFLQVALTCINRTPALAECSQSSLFEALLTLSSLGLEPDGRLAHLIPYGAKVTVVIDYKGIVELLMRSGEVSKIHADVVRESDEFEYDMGEIKRHKIDFRLPSRGRVYAVYAMVAMKDGSVACCVMSVADVEDIRKRSFSPNKGPWVTDWNEMAKKTAFKRLSKWLSLSPELRDRIEKDEDFSDVTINTDAPPARENPVIAGALPAPAPGLATQPPDAPPMQKRGPGRPPKARQEAPPPTIDVPPHEPVIPGHQADAQAWLAESGIQFSELSAVLDEFGKSPAGAAYSEIGQLQAEDWAWVKENALAIKQAIEEARPK